MIAPWLGSAIVTVALVLGRVGTLFTLLPVFSMMGMPKWITALLALGCSGLIASGLPLVQLDDGMGPIVVALAGEVAAGLSLGLGVSATFAALALGAEIMSLQAGLSFATLVDPLTRSNEGVLGTFASWIGGLVFVSAGLHGRCLEIVAASFAYVPAGTAAMPHVGPGWAITLVSTCTALGVQLAAPVLAGVWLVHLFVALLSKLAPRMNAFFSVGMTVTGAAGLGLLLVSLPWVIAVHGEHLSHAVDAIARQAALSGR